MNRHLRFRDLLRTYTWTRRAGLLPLVRPLLRLVPGAESRKLRVHLENWRRGIPPYAERGMDAAGRYDASYERHVYELAIARYRAAFEARIGGDFGRFFTYLGIRMCPGLFFHDPVDAHLAADVFPVPAFWDDGIVGLALGLPTAWKLRGKTTKYALRKAAAARIEPRYWMLPKIGLQSAEAFATATPQGAAWLARARRDAAASAEYAALARIVPGGAVDPDRLVPLAVWRGVPLSRSV
jgi:hypothetical protein